MAIVGVFIERRRHSPPPEQAPEARTDSKRPSLSLKKISQTSVKNGVREWSLEADSARYFKEKNRAVFENPSLVFFRKNAPNIQIFARQGVLLTDSNRVEAMGAVRALSGAYALRADKIAYDDKKRAIVSMAPSRIRSGASVLQADRISIFLDEDRTVFEGNVKGTLDEHFAF